MTDEAFLDQWIRRKTGRDFIHKYPEYAQHVLNHLAKGLLPTCDPSEKVKPCTCPDNDKAAPIRFYLDGSSFIVICTQCDSWSVLTPKKKRDWGKGK